MNNQSLQNQVTTPLPDLSTGTHGRIDGKPSTRLNLFIHLPEEQAVLLGWIALSYSVSRSMLINQMVAWAWYAGRCDTALHKLMRETARRHIPKTTTLHMVFPQESVDRMAALYHRCLKEATKDAPELLENLHRKFTKGHEGDRWSANSLVVTACFLRWQRMFVDLSRWQPDLCEGASNYVGLPSKNSVNIPEPEVGE